MKVRSWIIAGVAALAMLALGGAALAAQGQGNSANAGANGKGNRVRAALSHVMHSHTESFVDGKVVKRDADHGAVVSTSDNSIDLKFEDGSQAHIETVGEVHACVNGNPDAKITDLQGGQQVVVVRVTNAPKGDRTNVVEITNDGKLGSCRKGKSQDNNPAPQQNGNN